MSQHQQRLEDLKASSKKSLLVVAGFFVVLLLVYIISFHHINNIAPDGFGQFGDYIGGLLNPLVGFLALIGLWKTASIQTEMLKEQIEREQKQREHDRQEAAEDKQHAIFTRDFEAYQKTIETIIYDRDGVLIRGKAALYTMLTRDHEFLTLNYLINEQLDSVIQPYEPTMENLHGVFYSEQINTCRFLNPLIRTISQILRNQTNDAYKVGDDSFNNITYDNIRFFRAQLSNEEMIFIALYVLFITEDEAFAKFIQDFGLLKYLETPLLMGFVHDMHGAKCFGRKFAQNAK